MLSLDQFRQNVVIRVYDAFGQASVGPGSVGYCIAPYAIPSSSSRFKLSDTVSVAGAFAATSSVTGVAQFASMDILGVKLRQYMYVDVAFVAFA